MSDPSRQIQIAVIGDLLLTTPYQSATPGRGLEALSPGILDIFASCDLVVANLECTLPGPQKVTSEPRVFGSREQIASLATAGIDAVTLSNNHMFDFLDEGFLQTRDSLQQQGIRYFGAGLDLQEASQPLCLNLNGIQIALLAAVTPSTGMTRFATAQSSGTPELDPKRTCSTVRDLKSSHDHVILMPHWGEERFRFPAPEQIEQAHSFIDAGASLVLGHHPHVIQGTEHYQKGFIAYSLSNFLANDVHWENGDQLTWNRFERTGLICLITLKKNSLEKVELIPTFDNGEQINIDQSGWGDKCLRKADRYLQRGIDATAYKKESFRVNSILPIKNQLRWERLRRIRPQDFKKALDLALQRR